MSWRTVIINNRAKLDLKMGFLVVRGEEVKRVYLDEIAIIIIENPAVSLTGCLIEAIVERKIKLIFCDSTHSPMAELVSFHGSHDNSKKLKQQIAWDDTIKGQVWSFIVADKIKKQALHLLSFGKENEASLIDSYIDEIEINDITNREGHAAKVYFNALFGKDFTRDDDKNPINIALNYGYTIILSAFNREIVANGYNTILGIHHDNVYNHFNLSSDLMEGFRILVDREVALENIKEFNKDVKRKIINMLNREVMINDNKQTVLNAIKIYVKSVFDALNEKDISLIKFYDYEL